MTEQTIKKRGRDGRTYLYAQHLDDEGVVTSEELIGPADQSMTAASKPQAFGSVDQFIKDSGMTVQKQGNKLLVTKAPDNFWPIMNMLNLDKPCDIPGCDALREEYKEVVEQEKSRVGCPGEKQDCVERAVRRKFFPRAKALWEASQHTSSPG